MRKHSLVGPSIRALFLVGMVGIGPEDPCIPIGTRILTCTWTCKRGSGWCNCCTKKTRLQHHHSKPSNRSETLDREWSDFAPRSELTSGVVRRPRTFRQRCNAPTDGD